MELSYTDILDMRSGTVIHRFMTTRNAHRKFVVYSPQIHTECDICSDKIGLKGIKIEANGGKIRGKYCPLCAIDEILDSKKDF